MAGVADTKELLLEEIVQLSQEGREIDVDAWRQRIQNCDHSDKTTLKAMYDELCELPMRHDFPYYEPTELDEIFAASDIDKLPEDKYTDVDIDYFYGAWLGRCIGCALGQPCEAWSSQAIIDWYKNAGKYPIRSYFPTVSGENRNEGWATDEKICGMPIDDDTRFTVLNYMLVRDRGVNFDAWDVGAFWTSYFPFRVIFTAEAQSYLNFINIDIPYPWAKPENAVQVLRDHKISTDNNPYREWIGAQIRADAFGYLAAGMPRLAAKMAHSDAYFSHVKNGIYGEMFFATLISAAFTEKDINKCFETALSVIPKNSRFYEEAVWAKNLAETDISRGELRDILVKKALKYHNVHTINNAAFCVAAIMRYKNDFRKAVAFAVECGMDTDCNGATVGSVMGALLGAQNIPADLVAPLDDKFSVGVHPYNMYSIKGFAQEVKDLFDTINRQI